MPISVADMKTLYVEATYAHVDKQLRLMAEGGIGLNFVGPVSYTVQVSGDSDYVLGLLKATYSRYGWVVTKSKDGQAERFLFTAAEPQNA